MMSAAEIATKMVPLSLGIIFALPGAHADGNVQFWRSKKRGPRLL
jgi:hypothetical protein